MELLRDLGNVKSCFGLFGDSVSVGARQVNDLHQTYHRLRYRFGCTRWYSGDKAQVEAHFSPFGGSVNLDAR